MEVTAAATTDPALGYLEVLNSKLAGRLYALGAETIIGRLEEEENPVSDHVYLPDPTVSRRHARIIMQPDGLFLEDLQSTNGTFLNAFQLKPGVAYRLKEGGNLQIGAIHLRFRPANSHALSAWEETPEQVTSPAQAAAGAEPGRIPLLMIDSGALPADASVMIRADDVLKMLGNTDEAESQASTVVLRRLQAMAKLSMMLAAETSRDSLFNKVMEFIFEILPSAERAFAVLRDETAADPEALLPAAAVARDPARQEVRLALSRTIVHEVISQKRSVLSTDAGTDQRFGSHESIISLGIRSVMCVPMIFDDKVVGLIQVDTYSQKNSFTRDDLQILTGIAAQAAIALKNFRLYDEIENLFKSFVTASVHAIEARDPTTAGHSFRVAEYTERLATAVNRCEQGDLRRIQFSREQLRELRYAALLHDFGKVGVREHVLIKGKKLYQSQWETVQTRAKYFQARLEAQAYRDLVEKHGEVSRPEFRRRQAAMRKTLDEESRRLQDFLAMIGKVNEPSILECEVPPELLAVAAYRINDDNGDSLALLTDLELQALTLAKGSLTPSERQDIQSHVSHTYAFLKHIPWTGALAAVPDIAHAHHEKLDGSGYPRGLRGDEIPLQSRIMTIADIFDALTAGDRPYKHSLGIEQALDILREEGRNGKIEPRLVEVFIDSRAYQIIDVH